MRFLTRTLQELKFFLYIVFVIIDLQFHQYLNSLRHCANAAKWTHAPKKVCFLIWTSFVQNSFKSRKKNP